MVPSLSQALPRPSGGEPQAHKYVFWQLPILAFGSTLLAEIYSLQPLKKALGSRDLTMMVFTSHMPVASWVPKVS